MQDFEAGLSLVPFIFKYNADKKYVGKASLLYRFTSLPFNFPLDFFKCKQPSKKK